MSLNKTFDKKITVEAVCPFFGEIYLLSFFELKKKKYIKHCG